MLGVTAICDGDLSSENRLIADDFINRFYSNLIGSSYATNCSLDQWR